MWTHPLIIAFVAGLVGGLGSSLLTIFLTPRLQHHFWKLQRREELRLVVINEFNGLRAEFLTGYIAAPTTYAPSADWHKAFTALSSNIKTLFSDGAFVAFKAAEVMIGPGKPGLGALGQQTANDFVEARDAALRALYREVIDMD
jgi:hypothetical protein